MEKSKKIEEIHLEQVSGAGNNNDTIEIKVKGLIWPKGKKIKKTGFVLDFFVEPETTVREVEMKTYMSQFADDAECRSYYNGVPINNRYITMKMLGIKPGDTLEIMIEAEGQFYR